MQIAGANGLPLLSSLCKGVQKSYSSYTVLRIITLELWRMYSFKISGKLWFS